MAVEPQDQNNAEYETARSGLEQTFLNRPDLGSMSEQKAQAASIVRHAQKSLNVSNPDLVLIQNDASGEPTESLYINKDLALELRNTLFQLKLNSPSEDENFTRGEINGNTVKMLDRLIKEKAQTMGIDPSAQSLQQHMIHLMTIDSAAKFGSLSSDEQELDRLFSLKNISELMTSGSMTSGVYYGGQILAEKPWVLEQETHDDHDRLFNPETYKAMNNGHEVSAAIMFSESLNDDPVKHAKLMDIANELNIDTSAGHILSSAEVGAIAKEMLLYEAEKKWCVIKPEEEFDPSKINEAIHSFEFMPHLDDLLLVEKGMGIPPELKDEYEAAQNADDPSNAVFRFDLDNNVAIQKYRSEQFANTFGEIPEGASSMGRPEFSKEYEQSPARFFFSGRSAQRDASQQKSVYEMERDKYLERTDDGKAGCAVVDNDCLVNGNDTTCGTPFASASTHDRDTASQIMSNAEEVTGECIVNNTCVPIDPAIIVDQDLNGAALQTNP